MPQFEDQVSHVLLQIRKNPNGLFHILDEKQTLGMVKICDRTHCPKGDYFIREGDPSLEFGIIISGRVKIDLGAVTTWKSDQDGPEGTDTLKLGCGEVVGEMEMCQMDGSALRMFSVIAVDDCTMASYRYDTFASYVEGLGSKMAKRLSKRFADAVLLRLIQNEDRAEREDRFLLKNIGKTRNHRQRIGS